MQTDTEMDVVALAGTSRSVCAAILRYRDGRLADKREFLFRDTADIAAVREEFLPQYYLGGERVPKVIAVDALPSDSEALNQALNQARGSKVELYVPQRGDVAKLVTMAYTNAVERLGRESGRYTREEKLLEEVAQVLGLKAPPHMIESYDISNWGRRVQRLRDGRLQGRQTPSQRLPALQDAVGGRHRRLRLSGRDPLPPCGGIRGGAAR